MEAREVAIKFCGLLLSQRLAIEKKLGLNDPPLESLSDFAHIKIVICRAKARGQLAQLRASIGEADGGTDGSA